MIYLASPYSDPDPAVEDRRYRSACYAVNRLIMQRNFVFSPIVYCHPIRRATSVDGDAVYWWDFNVEFLEIALHFMILTLDGWETSLGVAREIGFFAARGVDPEFIEEIYE